AAHAVADHDRMSTDTALSRDRQNLACPLFRYVVGAMVAVAVTRQVDRDHSELVRERRSDVGPPVRVCAATMDEHESTPASDTPREVVDGGTVNDNLPFLERDGERPAEPLGRVRVDGYRIGHGQRRYSAFVVRTPSGICDSSGYGPRMADHERPRILDRRQALGAIGVLGIGAVAAACSSKSSSPAAASTAK